ncbi:hypothetical protein GQ607_006199 [Colletotrichum asianum]|uniref:Uncharacterized protein n=1 Tax=Colletotrichum asianum TaxID=702518 RepID=A0A8H3WD29_9PEZI|nr:hypothetical protein GQ607_006199 [Colletotrichum asianum]
MAEPSAKLGIGPAALSVDLVGGVPSCQFLPASSARGHVVPEEQSVKCLAQPTHATVNSSGAGANSGKGSRVCTASVTLVLVVAASRDGAARQRPGVPKLGLAALLGCHYRSCHSSCPAWAAMGGWGVVLLLRFCRSSMHRVPSVPLPPPYP